MPANYTIPVKDLHKHSSKEVGSLVHKLSQLNNHKIPIVPGFCVTQAVTAEFFRTKDLRKHIDQQLSGLSLLHQQKIINASKFICNAIEQTRLSDKLSSLLSKEYAKYSKNNYVQLSLSAAEDVLPEAILFKDSDTPIRVKGDANFLLALKREWSKLYSPDAISYRLRRNHNHHHIHLAVLVQVLPTVKASGVVSSVDTLHHDKNMLTIEAVWGVSDELLKGQQDADLYQVEKNTWRVDRVTVAAQNFIRRTKDPDKRKRVLLWKRKQQKLEPREIVLLSKIASKVQQQLFFPQHIQWILTSKGFFVQRVDAIQEQVNPLTETIAFEDKTLATLGKGQVVSTGYTTGKARVIYTTADYKQVKRGEILVLSKFEPQTLSYLPLASGIVAEHGAVDSHPAIVAREVEVPVISSVENITKKVHTGDNLTLDATHGVLFAGISVKKRKTRVHKLEQDFLHKETATKLFASISNIDEISDTLSSIVDGAGLINAKSLLSKELLLSHLPITHKNSDQLLKLLEDKLALLCENVGERPVFYWLTDFLSDELIDHKPLRGQVSQEKNSLLGYHGGWQHSPEQGLWQLEIRLLTKLRKKHKNLFLVPTFTRTAHEYSQFMKHSSYKNYSEHQGVPNLWFSIHTPEMALTCESFLKKQTKGISIHLDDLVGLTQAFDPRDEHSQPYLNTSSEGVKILLESVIEMCQRKKLPSILVLESHNISTELLHWLVSHGIYAISVPYHQVLHCKHEIILAEKSKITKL